jgi:hypothetical protein
MRSNPTCHDRARQTSRSPYSDVPTSHTTGGERGEATWNFLPHQAAMPVDARAFEGHWGPLCPPVARLAQQREMEQWTVCGNMIRGGRKGLRAHFARATISTCRLSRREQRIRFAPAGSQERTRLTPCPAQTGCPSDRLS